MSRIGFVILFVTMFANVQSVSALEQEDKNMMKLAQDSGCDLCHRMNPRKPGANEVPPPGPAWKDIAKKYKGQRDAVDRLTQTVLQGTGPSSEDRHWRYKSSGVAMFPNSVEIKEVDARKLVQWILSLAK